MHRKPKGDLNAVLTAGVVAVRDAGHRENAGQRIVQGTDTAADVRAISCGWALYKKGGYGSLFGVPVETRAEIASEIERLRQAGAGVLKVMASGLVSLKDPGMVTPGGFDSEELLFLVQEAAAHGMGVMAHANGERAILAAAKAGVRSIEHGFFMTERALDVLARKGVFWVPTAGALQRAARSPAASEAAEVFAIDLIRDHLEMIHRAHRTGVPLAVGTDCVLPDPGYQAAYEAELAFFEESGIPRDEVIVIASEGGAKLLGISTGSSSINKTASSK